MDTADKNWLCSKEGKCLEGIAIEERSRWEASELEREQGLSMAIAAAGGVAALARAMGISQPAVSAWDRVPAERVLAVENATGVSRTHLRPDLYPDQAPPMQPIDDVDMARANEYALLGALLWRAPSVDALAVARGLRGDATALGVAHIALSEAAASADAEQVAREYFNLFIGVGRGDLLPYASFYRTGFLHERPLADVRSDMERLGLARTDRAHEPEDHIALLFDVMAGLIRGEFAAPGIDEATFFRRHLAPWAGRFFADLEVAPSAGFYKAVARVGGLFMDIEAEAQSLPA
jgi:TorA maturation chaperone TorD